MRRPRKRSRARPGLAKKPLTLRVDPDYGSTIVVEQTEHGTGTTIYEPAESEPTMPELPKIGDTVHYQAYGTPGGEYQSVCRAATVTEVGQWIVMEETAHNSFSSSDGRPIRSQVQWLWEDALAMHVHNPTGLFINGGIRHDTGGEFLPRSGGTWHLADHSDCAE